MRVGLAPVGFDRLADELGAAAFLETTRKL
jgi:hypothetical protein